MIYDILAYIGTQPRTFTSVDIFAIVVILIYGGIIALIIIGLIRLVRFLGTAGKEQKLLRMELGKLADEVHLIRQELKEAKNSSKEK